MTSKMLVCPARQKQILFYELAVKQKVYRPDCHIIISNRYCVSYLTEGLRRSKTFVPKSADPTVEWTPHMITTMLLPVSSDMHKM